MLRQRVTRLTEHKLSHFQILCLLATMLCQFSTQILPPIIYPANVSSSFHITLNNKTNRTGEWKPFNQHSAMSKTHFQIGSYLSNARHVNVETNTQQPKQMPTDKHMDYLNPYTHMITHPYREIEGGREIILLTASHSLKSSPGGNLTASLKFPLPKVASICCLSCAPCNT